MKMIFGCMLAATVVLAQSSETLPEATTLQEACKQTLPDIPLLITGELQAKNKDGDLEQKLNLEMILDWRNEPASARYTLRNNFGEPEEHLSVTWTSEGTSEYRYFTGNPLTATSLPPLDEPVQKTDISWLDLSLSYLWWTNSATIGSDEIRGRFCYIIEAFPPKKNATSCKAIRAWIDPQINLLLKAETFNAQDELVRRMEIKSFKKIRGRWVIENIEIQSFPTRHKTIWRVRDVKESNRTNYLPAEQAEDETIDKLDIPTE